MKKKILLVLILLVIGAWFLTSEKRVEQHVIADIEQTSELTQSIAITQSRYESKHLDIHEEMPSEIGFELLEEPNVNAVIVNLSDEQIVKRAKEIVKEARLPEEVEPVLEHKEKFTVVYWPVILSEESLQPGPSKYAEVVFRKNSLTVLEVLGAH